MEATQKRRKKGINPTFSFLDACGHPPPPGMTGIVMENKGESWLAEFLLSAQLDHDCQIKMIQAEWYLMIYGVRPPVLEKAAY